MTLDELDIAVLGELGETQSDASFDSTAIRYRILNRAYRHVCRKTWLTWRGASTWTVAASDETFDLFDKLGLAVGYDVLDVVRCYYIVPGITQTDLAKRSLATIKGLRGRVSDPGYYPKIYAFYRYDDSGTKKAYLDIYPPIKDAGSDIFYIDWLENPPTLTSSQDLITPSYADDCITLWGAAFMARAMPSVLYGELMRKAEEEIKEIRAQSHKEAAGYIQSKIAK